MQISYLASASSRVSSIDAKSGPKANIQDISAHPVRTAFSLRSRSSQTNQAPQYPALVVQAHKLAAKALADEIQSSVFKLDTQRIPELTGGLDNCMQGLQSLREALVMFPDTNHQGDKVVP
jgi:hypothetical protein